jgi:hypothetical protein
MFYPQSSWAKSYYFVLIHSNMWLQIDINSKNAQSFEQNSVQRWMDGALFKNGGSVSGKSPPSGGQIIALVD